MSSRSAPFFHKFLRPRFSHLWSGTFPAKKSAQIGAFRDWRALQDSNPSTPEKLSPPRTPTSSFTRGGPASQHMESLFIGISGLIGAGKSTLATSLGEVLGLPVYYEPVINNEYLADFYLDQEKYAFPLQIYLLNKRFRQHQQIIWQNKGGVQDRTIYEDAIFAKMLKDTKKMSERDYRTYMELFQNMANFMRKPNLIVHLDVSPEESLRRIKLRQRECESGIPLEYLVALREGYEEFIQDIAKVIPVIKVNYQQFQNAETMAEVIKREWNRIQNIHEVDFPANAISDNFNSPNN